MSMRRSAPIAALAMTLIALPWVEARSAEPLPDAVTTDPAQAEATGLARVRAGQFDAAREPLEIAARAGRAAAQFALGQILEDQANGLAGDAAQQKFGEALGWYERAADQNYAPALNNLGAIYFDGRGVERNLDVAVRMYRRAADTGNAEACYNLALLIAQKRASGEPEEAVKLLKRASDQGFVKAQAQLARIYLDGDLVPNDPREAARLFRLAAAQGHGWSQFFLGMMLRSGIGVTRNLDEAYTWIDKAARQEVPLALYQKGIMLDLGLGVPANRDAARQAWQRALDLGVEEAQQKLAETADPKKP